MVSTLNSHPADRGSIPLMNLKFFLFFLVILLRKYSLIIQKVQNSTQKLFVQFHYFKLFMYVYITYNEKKESKVLGHLLLITIIFWTVWLVLIQIWAFIFMYLHDKKKLFTFKLGSCLEKHAKETNTKVFVISSGGFVNLSMKLFRYFLVTILKP